MLKKVQYVHDQYTILTSRYLSFDMKHKSLGEDHHLDKVSNDGEVGIIPKGDDLLVDHQAKDAHHGRTTIIKLDGTLGELGLLIKVIPPKVNVSVTEITHVFIAHARDVPHDGNFQKSDKRDQLHETGGGNGVGPDQGGNTIGERIKGIPGVVNISRQVEAPTCHDLSEEGKLTDPSVLDLDVPEPIEAFLGAVTVEQAKGVKEPKGGLGSKLILEGADGRGSLDCGCGCEGGGRAEDGSDDNRLHYFELWVWDLRDMFWKCSGRSIFWRS